MKNKRLKRTDSPALDDQAAAGKGSKPEPPPEAAFADGEDPLMTVQDVMDWFQVKRSWVYDHVESGRLPSVRIGRQLRFRRTDLDHYLKTSTRLGFGPRLR